MPLPLATVSFTIPTDLFFGGFVAGLLLLYAAMLVVLGVQFSHTFRPERRARAVEKLSASANLVVSDAVREPLERYVAVRTRGGLLGGMIALPMVLVVIQPWADPPPSFGVFGGILAFTMVLGGILVGTLAGGVMGRRPSVGTPRAARITELGLRDLLAPVERKLLLACVLGGLAGPGVLLAALQAPWVDPAMVVTAGAPWLVLAGASSAVVYFALPAIARRLVAARALAGDENALAWSDTLAARTLRETSYLVIAVGGMTALLAFLSLGFALPDEWTVVSLVWGNLGFYVGMAAIIAAVLVVVVRRPERHVQRTLWPEFAADAQ